ncbi:MAG: hypothetical protein ACPGNV_00400 [Mangrovicoccus sp.]
MSNDQDEIFRRVLTSQDDLVAASLATKILVARLRADVSEKPESLDKKVKVLADFFAKHRFASKDLAVL